MRKAIKKSDDDYLNKNSVAVFSFNNVNSFIDFDKVMIDNGSSYPFLISNTNWSHIPETHW